DIRQGGGVGGVDAVGDLVGVCSVGLQRIDAHPMPSWTGELDDLGGRVAAAELVLQLDGVLLAREGPDLNAPTPCSLRTGGSECFDAHSGDPDAIDADGLRGGKR